MKWLIASAAALLLVSCGGKSSQQGSTLPGEKTDECAYQEEVCREALAFQSEYEKMSNEEKEQMTPVLNSYIEHCEVAKKACKKSMR